ncbi:hypothetical protein AB0F77_25940 [Streptomyces sp. NPDC026672]|uniref:hypothetical protein n=1 Tax=unclassified Streptomyces TaxID=2593676 RepID=UPI0033DC4B7E
MAAEENPEAGAEEIRTTGEEPAPEGGPGDELTAEELDNVDAGDGGQVSYPPYL